MKNIDFNGKIIEEIMEANNTQKENDRHGVAYL